MRSYDSDYVVAGDGRLHGAIRTAASVVRARGHAHSSGGSENARRCSAWIEGCEWYRPGDTRRGARRLCAKCVDDHRHRPAVQREVIV